MFAGKFVWDRPFKTKIGGPIFCIYYLKVVRVYNIISRIIEAH